MEYVLYVHMVDSELNVLTPNSLLLGRFTAKNHGGWQPFTYNQNTGSNSTVWWPRIATTLFNYLCFYFSLKHQSA